MVKKPYRSKKCAGQTGTGEPPCIEYDPKLTNEIGGPSDSCTYCKWFFDSQYEPIEVVE